MLSRRLTPLIVASGLFMENLDGTVLSTALPAIAADLHRDPITLKLALTAYLVSLAVFIPASGWVADRFGARNVFCAAIGVFTLASIACGFSADLPTLVLGRLVQGMGGAMMVPVGRLIVFRSTPKSELVGAFAMLTMPALFGPLLGPPLGGFITTYFHWRWIFWINVPIGILGAALAWRFLPNDREETPPPFDAKGFALSGVGLVGAMFGFTALGRGFLPLPAALGLLAVGALALAAYVRHARVVRDPILDLGLFRIQTFRASVLGGWLFRLGIGAIPFLLPLMFQLGFGMTAFQSGLLTLAAAAGALLMKSGVTRVLRVTGFRSLLIWNGVLCAAFLAANALFTAQTPRLAISAVLLVGGLFRSLQFTSLNALGFADVPTASMSRATSLSGVAQQLALSSGVAVGAAAIQLSQFALGDASLVSRDFVPAFFALGALALLAVPVFAALPDDVGAELAGGRSVPRPAE
ncbi:MAG: MFS transporter [Hyphomicrobiales bacterium]|nr:MFS transporter [Hyphomicrobiales bacterium]